MTSKQQTQQEEEQQQQKQNEMSFYIPRIHKYYTTEDIKATFRVFNIGEIERIDYVNKRGDDTYYSAFVYMSYMYNTTTANDIMYYLQKEEGYYQLWVEKNVFWWILKNKNPIDYTHYNIHQVVENARLLKEQLVEHEYCIEEQRRQIVLLREEVYKLTQKRKNIAPTNNASTGDNNKKNKKNKKSIINKHREPWDSDSSDWFVM